MAITTKDFTTLVRDQVTAIQAGARVLVDLTIGSILRAAVEANASVHLWLQGLILYLLATTRAATSNGADLDSWALDFSFTRLAAVAATGQVTFARFTPAAQAVVLVGATVQTGDGSQKYTVTLDTTNSAYNSTLGGYVLAAAVASINVPVAALVAGSAGNAQAAQINSITSPISGVDTCSNAAPFTNGADAESDPAFRLRFISYIASLSKATKQAIGNAITSLKQGVTYTLTENLTYGGVAQPGYFYVVVDDGTGSPSGAFLSTVSNAIDAVRGFTISFGVFAPTLLTANIAATIVTAAGYDHTATAALVGTAIRNYINALPLGTPLSYSRISQVAYDASPGVTNVTGATINAGTADISATAQQIIKAGTVAIA
jgi:uncharacterized phage protein gp47/JayE